MGNPRSFTSKFNALNRALETAVKPAGFNSLKRRRELVSNAASGRPRDLPEQARVSVALRRIAGTPSRIDSQEGK